MAIALHHSRATGTAKLVLIGIANHEGDGGAWPSVATLAKYANVTVRNVQTALAKLEELGEIRRFIQQGGDWRTQNAQRPNRYEVTLTCPPECDRTTAHRCAGQATPTGVSEATPGVGGDTRGVSESTPKPPVNPTTYTGTKKSHVGRRARGEHKHTFDELSGWCECGTRDDGTVVSLMTGKVIKHPPRLNNFRELHNPDELDI